MDGLSFGKNKSLSHDSYQFWTLTSSLYHSEHRKKLSSSKDRAGCPPQLPASSASNTQLLVHWVWSLASLHTTALAWGTTSERACVGGSCCCCCTVSIEFSQLVDCQRPLISHLWVSLPLRIFPSAAFHLAQVKLCLPASPFQKHCSVCFGSSRLCWLWLHVLWLLTHGPAGHLYLIPNFSLSSALCSSAQTLLPHNA